MFLESFLSVCITLYIWKTNFFLSEYSDIEMFVYESQMTAWLNWTVMKPCNKSVAQC